MFKSWTFETTLVPMMNPMKAKRAHARRIFLVQARNEDVAQDAMNDEKGSDFDSDDFSDLSQDFPGHDDPDSESEAGSYGWVNSDSEEEH